MNPIKILLINPPPKHRIEKDDMPDYPHIGLGYLASSLENSTLCECKILDCKLSRLGNKEVIKIAQNFQPHFIGLTAMTHEINRAASLALTLKNTLPKTFAIIGGVHASALPKDTMEEFKQFDLLVKGEAENTLPHLISSFSKTNTIDKTIRGIVYRENSNIQFTGDSEPIFQLDSIQFPAWRKFPKAKVYPILSSRGCPFKCVFCVRPYGTSLRNRSPENVINEIEYVIKNHSPKILKFYDETFAVNMANTFLMLDLIYQKDFHGKVKWWAYTRVDVATFELLAFMKKAGCYKVGFGIESGNKKIIKYMKKPINLDKAYNLVKYCRKIGLKTEAYFILGHPYETRDTIKDTINFAAKLNATLTSFGIMVPYPGTEIYAMALKNNQGFRLISHNWDDYNKQIGNALELSNIKRRELEKLQLYGYLKVFTANRRYFDLLCFFIMYKKAGIAYLKKVFFQ